MGCDSDSALSNDPPDEIPRDGDPDRVRSVRSGPVYTSPLWSETVRRIVSGEMMSQHEINNRRSQLLVPGT